MKPSIAEKRVNAHACKPPEGQTGDWEREGPPLHKVEAGWRPCLRPRLDTTIHSHLCDESGDVYGLDGMRGDFCGAKDRVAKKTLVGNSDLKLVIAEDHVAAVA